MPWKGLKIGFLVPDEFRRLGPHAGALWEWYRQNLPKPDLIVSLSGGAIIASAVSPWDEWHFERTQEVLCDMTSRNIFKVALGEKLAASLLAGAFLFPAVQALRKHKQKVTPWDVLIHAGMGLVGLGISAYGVKMLMHGPSIVDVSPLEAFLDGAYDYPAIRESDIEVRVMATDIENGEHVMFSSHDASLSNRDWLQAVLCSSTIPVYMKLRNFQGRRLTDGGVRSDFPIDQLSDMDVVFQFCYTFGPAAHPRQVSWGDHFNGMWSIAKGIASKLARKEYERKREKDPTLPEVVAIATDREIPDQLMENFNRETMKRSIELGKTILQENVANIREALERTLQKKRREKRWDRRVIGAIVRAFKKAA